MEQKGQIVSAAGAMDLSFFRSEKGARDRTRRIKRSIDPTGAAIRITQLIAEEPGSTGTVQKATEILLEPELIAGVENKRKKLGIVRPGIAEVRRCSVSNIRIFVQ